MEKDREKKTIKLSILQKLQQLFQKDLAELVEIYVEEAKRKINQLHQAFDERNMSKFVGAAQDLRYRSVDMGALQFSHVCLGLEIAAQEHRFESLKMHLALLENQFSMVSEELERIKTSVPLKNMK